MTAAEWNERHQIGTEVDLIADNGEVRRTKIHSAAWTLGSGLDAVALDGISGCYLLARVRAVGAA